MVGFRPGFATNSHFLFRGIVKPSFKTTGSYSIVIALSKISGYVLGVQSNCKAGVGGYCKHVPALLYNILNYVELGFAIIPEDKTCADTSQQWNRPRNIYQVWSTFFPEYSLYTIHTENVRQRLSLLD